MTDSSPFALLTRSWSHRSGAAALAAAGLAAMLLGLSACQSSAPPARSSQTYQEAVSAFYTGLAAIQVGENQRAERQLLRVTERAAEEPAAWANLGVLALRQRRLNQAARWMDQAVSQAPESAQVQYLMGVLRREQGQSDAARSRLRRAVKLDSTHHRATYALARLLARRDTETTRADAQRLLRRLLRQRPDNWVAQLEYARLAAERSQMDTLRQAVRRIVARVPDEPAALPNAAETLQNAVDAGDPQQAATRLTFLENALKRLPAYQTSQAALDASPSNPAALIAEPLWLPPPEPAPAARDLGLTFAAESLRVASRPWTWVRPYTLSSDGVPALVTANGRAAQVSLLVGVGGPTVQGGPQAQQRLRLDFPGGPQARPPGPHGITAVDYDYDFDMDLLLAGAGGLRLYRYDAPGTDGGPPRRSSGSTGAASDPAAQDAERLTDVTTEALPDAIARRSFAGAWTADLDMEGDVDLVLATPDGAPVVLRNRGDGTFERWSLFEDVTALRQFVWADLDGDGDPDAATIDAEGRLRVFANRRQRTPRFRPRPLPDTLDEALAFDVADLDRDGTLDLLVLRPDGTLACLSATPSGWTAAEQATWTDLPDTATAASTRLFLADLDNNGGLDPVVSTPARTQTWLRGADHALHPHRTLDAAVTGIADLEGRGRLDLVGQTPDGDLLRLSTQGTKDYNSTTLRPRAARADGDRRINSFGIGGEIELRAGLLFQKQPIGSPTVHFGLGPAAEADVARIIWPNGTLQAEFGLLANQRVYTEQRLKGSCPWLFAHNGDSLSFVTDLLWRTALGLRINAQGPARVIHSIDWIKVEGDQLAPRNGQYDLRITGELWETHFFDRVTLMAVDHPAGTEIFADERFVLPPPNQRVHVTGPLQPVAAAWNSDGGDVTRQVQARDGRYLDDFDLGPYQGRAEEHYVEVDLGDVPASADSLWLVASGWTYPTDTSINLAISQSDHAPPRGLRLEVPDGEGGWTVAKSNIGFPAGKTKTILLNITDAFEPGTPRRLRLRTNMEIYWDRIAWATGRPDADLRTHRLQPDTARLRYRGFSATRKPARSTPLTPVYDSLAATTPLWRDLVGYYTRFGDVRPLVTETDDRYVIMNAGDEMRLRFAAPDPPPEGWTRDFILVGDGWVKDGDYNTGYSKTVRPLPYHGLEDYSQPPVPLEQDPAYQRHPEDWATYHTRYVTPRRFQRALAPKTNASASD